MCYRRSEMRTGSLCLSGTDVPRVAPHFKIHTSIGNHRKMIDVYSDDRLLAMWVRIGVLGIERYADRTEDSFVLSNTDLVHVTGCANPGAAWGKLKALTKRSPLTVEAEGSHWRLTFPNFARKQGFQPKNGEVRGASSSSASSASTTKNKKSRSPPSASDRATRMAEALREKVLKQAPGAQVPRTPAALGKWALELERLSQRDGVSWSEIDQTLLWLFGPNVSSDRPFVVQSPKSLAEKWGRIRVQVGRSEHGKDAALIAKYPALAGGQ